MFRKLSLFCLAVLLAAGSVFLYSKEDPTPIVVLSSPSQNIFRLKSFSDSFQVQLDPIHADASVFISEQLFNGLVILDSDLNPAPSLAEYWHKEYDGKRHRFDLRQGVRFHHGTEMTADDVKYSLERILDPESASPYAVFFLDRVQGAREFFSGQAGEVTGFRVLDRYTFEILWKKPYAMALSLLSMHFCKILPKDLVMEQGRGYFQKPSGTGPYQFRHWVRDNHLEIVGVQMERYPGYFEGIPNIEFVEFCPFYQMEDFIAGDIHAIPVISDRLLQLDYQIFRDGSIYPFFLGMSCHLVPLDDPQVRRAIAVGINKPEIVRATHEARYHRQLLHSFIPPKLPGFFLTDEINTYNLTDARSHLKEAGYISEKKLPDITLMMEHPRTDFKHRFFVELRRQLDALGIELKEKYYRRENEVRNFRKPYLILRGQLLDFPGPEDIIRTLFATDSPGNLCRFSNAELDRLLQTAEQEKSWNERNKQFLQIQKILSLNMPAVPLFSQQNRVAVQPFIRGIVNPPLGFYYIKMKNVRIER